MKKVFPPQKIFVDKSEIPNAGSGVFAKAVIGVGELIEVCPVVEVSLKDSANDDEKGRLTDYFFYFGDDLAMALGYGALYNHSYTPNAQYLKIPEQKVIEFYALTHIAVGEEITVNYNGDPLSQKPIGRGVPDPEPQ